MGYRKSRKPSLRTMRKIEKAVRDVIVMIRPRVLYKEFSIRRAGNGTLLVEDVEFKSRKLSRAMRPCLRATVFVATIGRSLDRKIAELQKCSRMSDAYLYDAIGSVAVEDTLDMFQHGYEDSFRKLHQKTTPRFSPGYCDWKVQEQKKLFKLVKSEIINVSLQPSCLMTPRKSISGLFGVGLEERLEEAAVNPCVYCGILDCPERRI
jgi:hypothetical protein